MSTVYKYCDARGVAILENLELKVTPPNQFNDPFEFTPRMVWSDPRGRATAILGNKKYMNWLYQQLKAERQFRGSFRKFHDHVRAHRQELAEGLSRFIPLGAAASQQEQKLLDEGSKKFGILCLSKRRDSILMWGHYCDKHRGLVIGFDESNNVFRPKVGRGLRSVLYVRERVIFDATWDEADPKVTAFDEQMTFSKNEDWRYEAEMRQLFQLSSLKGKPLDDGRPGYFLPISPEALVSVTLGARCPRELEKKTRSAVTQASLSHVKVDRAVLHDTEFALRFE